MWRGPKTWSVVLLLALTAALTASPAGAAAAPRLKEGASVFWKGGYADSATVPSPELCGVSGPCWTYPLELAPTAQRDRLRVAIDWPSDGDSFQLELLDPSGKVAATSSGGSTGRWSVELFVPKPAAGVWTARVIAEDVSSSSFRARAKLERTPVAPKNPKLLPPNLQANPPWDVGLVAPVPQPTAAPLVAAPFEIVGMRPFSCTVDEMVINSAQRCLRFSVGPLNVGAGPYEARIDMSKGAPNAEGHLAGPVTQRVYRSDGSFVDRSAGKFVFHEAHGHLHVQDLLAYSLYRVDDARTGKLEQVGKGAKASFCTLDLQVADFRRFQASGPPGYADPSVCFEPPGGDTTIVMGVTPGWSDVYTWNLPDQYVDWAQGGEGLYVVRVVVDGGNTILESNERDNTGYALIDVVGDEVRLVERGIGKSPWDKRKVVSPPRS